MDFHSLSVLEYDKIKHLLWEKAASDLGREACLDMVPLCDPERIQKSLDEISELRTLLFSIESSLQQVADPRSLLSRLEVTGTVLEPREINSILKVMEVSRRIRGSVKRRDHPALFQIVGSVVPCPEVERIIRKAISPDHEVLDGASARLKRLRRGKEEQKTKIRTELNSAIRKHKDAIQEDLITIRDSRYVMNVKSSKQKIVGGVVHGSSASGQSVFLEPLHIVNLNNTLVEMNEEEQKEVSRILASITGLICENVEIVKKMTCALKELDFIYAKAKFGVEYNCVSPELNTRNYLHIKGGRHPLLRDPVPLTIEIGDGWTTILLSGPNTGGKTVTLKTVGLLTLMAQSGMEIPADEGSTIGVFEEVFADIGDQQSIENSLSTFSSHMNQIIKVLGESNDRSLVLLDELGVGTDPAQGEALGMTVLDELTRRRTKLLATSHYANLKVWVHSREGMRNAAMLFNTKTLRPAYRFKMGVPGASYGLEIARKMGMAEKYLRTAESYVSSSNLKIDQLIRELEELKLEAMEKEEFLEIEGNKLSKLVTEYAARLSNARKEAKAVVKTARDEALSILDNTRRLVERLVKEIRERDKQVIKDVRRTLEREMASFAETPKPPINIEPFDEVYIRSLNSSGTVTEVVGGLARVDMGKFRVTVPISDLEK